MALALQINTWAKTLVLDSVPLCFVASDLAAVNKTLINVIDMYQTGPTGVNVGIISRRLYIVYSHTESTQMLEMICIFTPMDIT